MADEESRRQINMYMARLSGLDPARYGNFGGLPGLASGQMDKAKQVEVQRQQVDDVFKSLDMGVELAQSDPGKLSLCQALSVDSTDLSGPLIKTELFPHQRRALTFLLEREGDSSCLKKCRKTHDKKEEKKAKRRSSLKKENTASVAGSVTGDTVNGDEEKVKDEEKDEEDSKKGKKDVGNELI